MGWWVYHATPRRLSFPSTNIRNVFLLNPYFGGVSLLDWLMGNNDHVFRRFLLVGRVSWNLPIARESGEVGWPIFLNSHSVDMMKVANILSQTFWFGVFLLSISGNRFWGAGQGVFVRWYNQSHPIPSSAIPSNRNQWINRLIDDSINPRYSIYKYT